jgi:hypothetical protein
MQTQFIIDEKGKKIAVILPMSNYKKMLDDLDELEDIKLYDKAKKEDDGKRISFADYLLKRQAKNA